MSVKKIEMPVKKTSLLLLLVGILASIQVMAFESFVVQKIRIQGLVRVSEAAVLNDLPVRIGQTITEEGASDAIRALYQTGFFKEVTLSKDGNTLVVQLKERPTISKLTLTGIRDKDKVEKLLREAGIAEGRMYDPAVLALAQKNIEKHYFTKGKFGVKIETTVNEVSPGLMSVKISIYEGDLAKIKQIKIVGNCVFTEKELLKDFYSAPTNWLSWFTGDDQYAKEKLNADLETLRSYYMDRGYLNIQIDSVQVSLTPNKKHIYITIHVTEGDKYVYGKIAVTGQLVVPEEKYRPILAPLKTGKTFSRKALLDAKQAIEDLLGSMGYSMAEAIPQHSVDEACKAVSITFEIMPGRRIYVRRIQFRGNATTKDEVLRRELPQMEGTWISTELIKEGKEKILRRGFASEVEVETPAVPGVADQVDVLYRLEEARLGQVSAGLGYSASERLMFNFSISQENFLGTGKIVDFTVDKSKSSSNYAFGYLDPYFTIDGIGMGFSAYYNKSNLSKTTRLSDYTTDMIGGDFRWIFPLGKYEAICADIGYDRTTLKIDRDDVAAEILAFIKKHGKRFSEYITGIGWLYDSLDQRIFPKRGMQQSLKLRVVTPGSTLRYYRATYDFAWFYPLTESEYWILNLTSNLGFGDGYDKTNAMPFYRNFTAGGSKYVRGFEENSLGPKDSRGRTLGGNALVAGTVAIIFPNPIKPDIKSVRTALFLDAGQVYDTHNRKKRVNGQVINHKVDGIRYSVGISLAWHSPLGAPLTFSLATPINAKKGDDKRVFNFWIGTQF